MQSGHTIAYAKGVKVIERLSEFDPSDLDRAAYVKKVKNKLEEIKPGDGKELSF